MTSVNPSGLDKALSDAMRALSSYQSTTQDPEGPPVEGHGEAADGLVRVRTEMPGRVAALEVDPRLLRLDLETLTEHIVAAVNAAMEDLQRTAPTTAGPVDLGELGRQLGAIQQDAARQFSTFVNGLAAAQERLGRRGG
ncbi:YbaB/EbfC family nucleoid-associated protein [Micromonospora sp. NPDC049051]|uniref:YbaB/EbfC family nucleoid-associated protein n=1 Tax=Micromonospora sp. NPDC049051 TaxID=3364264 RepID=UPI003715A5EF